MFQKFCNFGKLQTLSDKIANSENYTLLPWNSNKALPMQLDYLLRLVTIDRIPPKKNITNTFSALTTSR